jgi:hypothetical protein
MTTAEPDGSSGPTFRLMYRSHSRISPERRKAELGEIFSVARSKNKKAGITGALLIVDDWFVQVLEGDEVAVRGLYDRIYSDSRHERVSLITAQASDGRTFGRWAMAKVAEDGEPDIPLITNVNKGGIVPAAARPMTPEQEAVLATMRDSLRDTARDTAASGATGD